MPELPEVETIKRSLEESVTNTTVQKVDVYLPKIIKEPSATEFVELLRGKTITSISRRGKYLLIQLSGDLVMVVHFRMTGKFIYCRPGEKIPKHTHLTIALDNERELRYVDTRKFGRFHLVEGDHLGQISGLNSLGIEPLDERLTRDYLKKHLKFRRAKIKPLLLNQRLIAGIGNIYADEILHAARIHPERLACTLNARETANLYLSIKRIIREGIKYNGTSIRDYVDSNGRLGKFQNYLSVYNREGKQCAKCGSTITRKKIAGRSTYFCPSCQKAAN